MGDRIVIGLVVVIAIVAHVWLFRWVRFKIDEGVILRFLEESAAAGVAASQEISSHTKLKEKRVTAVCRKSRGIDRDTQAADTWCIKAV